MAIPTTYVNPNQTLAAGGLEGVATNVITATYWNRLAAMVHYLGGTAGYIGCRAHMTVAQSTADSTATALALGGETVDSDPNGAMHDNVTNNTRITIQTSGLYVVNGTITWAAHATGYRHGVFRVNGADFMGDMRLSVGGVASTGISFTAIHPFSATNYIEMFALHTAGTSLNVVAGTLAVGKL